MTSRAPKPDYLGHRQRVRHRILTTATPGLADYELLEVLLFSLFPRQDTKPLAKRLLVAFGSLQQLFQASEEELRQVEGVGEGVICFLKTVREIAARLARAEIREREIFSCWEKVLDYCRLQGGYEKIESFRVLFLNKRNQLLADEELQTGTIDHATIYPRELVKRALSLGASGLILLHNHPSGDPTPSRADVEVTKRIMEIAKPLGILVFDHIVITPKSHASLKNMGLI